MANQSYIAKGEFAKADPEGEDAFQRYYSKVSEKSGTNPNPYADAPKEKQYDYRKAYALMKLGMQGPSYQKEHNQVRWPDEGKGPDYQTENATFK